MNKPLRVCSAHWSYFYGRRRFLGTVLGCAAWAVLATASVSACTSGSPSTTPPSFSPGGTRPATPAISASGRPTVTTSSSAPGTSAPGTSAPGTSAPGTTAPGTSAPGTTAPGTTAPGTTAPGITAPSATAPSPSPSPPPSPSASSFPTAPPGAGGGGTAGFQDVLLFCLGVLAILAGAGSIAYRRKVMRDR